jgi:hypothetical protein
MKERKVPVNPPVVASSTGHENQYLLPVDSTQTGSDLLGSLNSAATALSKRPVQSPSTIIPYPRTQHLAHLYIQNDLGLLAGEGVPFSMR